MPPLTLTLTHHLRLEGAPPELRQAVMEKLEFQNPKWLENERMGRWNRGTPRVLKFWVVQGQVQSRGGGMGSMGGSTMDNAQTAAGTAGMPAESSADAWEGGRQSGSVVPLAVLADVRVVTGPPMIKNENGTLVGYVFADIDSSQRDLGGWVNDAKRLVAERLNLPPGFRCSGQASTSSWRRRKRGCVR